MARNVDARGGRRYRKKTGGPEFWVKINSSGPVISAKSTDFNARFVISGSLVLAEVYERGQ